ncbi:MAG: PQQ-binding-like beta-propeller repeat protein [Planctomycetaceae bacterium]|nr:PQQ-binding-like beta-propeller repeat protein [Planctomycetaceae bacterium]
MSPSIRLLIGLLATGSLCQAGGDHNWPQFRGPLARGIGHGRPPVTWDLQTSKNVAWKTNIPGLGHASPIVWGDRVYVATAVSHADQEPTLETGWLGGSGKSPDEDSEWTWQLLACDLNSGEIVWTKDVCSGAPAIKRHLKATHANCTPATDGKHLVAFFGSEGLYCFDLSGQLLWQKDFGKLVSGPYDVDNLEWGFASSPIIYDGRVIVQCDCLNTNFVAVLDVKTGEELLRIEREAEVATWSTPAIATDSKGAQIVCNGYRQMAGYRLRTGERLWHLNGGGDVPVPTPQVIDELVVLTNGHSASPTYAVKSEARGDITPTRNQPPPAGLAWSERYDGSYMPTPIIVDGLLYACNDDGRLAVRQLADGKRVYRQRVGTGARVYSASAVSAGGHIYFCSERGEVTVVRTGRDFEVAGRNEMGEVVMATPALSGDSLIIRTVNHLVCIRPTGERPSDDSVSRERCSP